METYIWFNIHLHSNESELRKVWKYMYVLTTLARVHIHLHLFRSRTSITCYYFWLFVGINLRLFAPEFSDYELNKRTSAMVAWTKFTNVIMKDSVKFFWIWNHVMTVILMNGGQNLITFTEITVMWKSSLPRDQKMARNIWIKRLMV